MPTRPLLVARALHAALEAGKHGDDLRPLFAEGASTVEHPNLVKPRGARTPLAEMLAASTAGADILASQTYAVRSAMELEGTAILRLQWSGVVARDVGPFRAGQGGSAVGRAGRSPPRPPFIRIHATTMTPG